MPTSTFTDRLTYTSLCIHICYTYKHTYSKTCRQQGAYA